MPDSITIAIPTFNRRDSVSALAASILEQMKPGDELLVCDDGSADGTAEALGSIPGVRLERSSENLGMITNWNACLTEASNPWICIVHDDDSVAPHALESIRAAIRVAAEPALIGHQRLGTDFDCAFRCRLVSPGPWGVFNDSVLIPSGVTIHRQIVDSVGPFDGRFAYSADIEYFARIGARFPSVSIESPPVVEYNQHGANYQYTTWRKPDFFTQLEEIERLVLKYSGLSGAVAEDRFNTRMVARLNHMLRSAGRIGDREVVRKTAQRLLQIPGINRKLRLLSRTALLTGWCR